MSRLLIVEEDAAVRAAFRQLLDAEASISEITEASSENEALQLLAQLEWDLVLLSSPTSSSTIDTLERVVLSHPNVCVLVISAPPEPQQARRVLSLGARGYICAATAVTELVRAVHVVLGGRRCVSISLADSMAADLEQIEDQPLRIRLSSREYQIFCKIARGDAITHIATELGLSIKTVSTYRSRIMEKMNFRSNADIEAYALKAKLPHAEQELLK
jgi:two-component system, NarL family, invasion response regulator UvrY